MQGVDNSFSRGRGQRPTRCSRKSFSKKSVTPRFSALANQLIRSESVDLIAGEAQLTVSRYYVTIDLQRRMAVLGEMMLSIHLQHDPLAAGEEQQEVHALPRKRKAMAQGFHDSGVIVKIDLRKERGQSSPRTDR